MLSWGLSLYKNVWTYSRHIIYILVCYTSFALFSIPNNAICSESQTGPSRPIPFFTKKKGGGGKDGVQSQMVEVPQTSFDTGHRWQLQIVHPSQHIMMAAKLYSSKLAQYILQRIEDNKRNTPPVQTKESPFHYSSHRWAEAGISPTCEACGEVPTACAIIQYTVTFNKAYFQTYICVNE